MAGDGGPGVTERPVSGSSAARLRPACQATLRSAPDQRKPRRSGSAIWAAITRHGIVSLRRNQPSSCRLSAVRSGGLAIPLATQFAVQRVRIAVCPWRDTKTSAELADEMRDAGVADLFGNPGHGELAVDQQLPRLVEAHLLDELIRRPAGHLSEQVRERGRAQADLLGQVGYGQWFGQVPLNLLENRRDRVVGGLCRGYGQQPGVLLALQDPVHHFFQVHGC